MTYDKNNIFAKILRGEAECVKVLENSKVLAFMDVMPQAPGHTLIIPKYETSDLLNQDILLSGVLNKLNTNLCLERNEAKVE